MAGRCAVAKRPYGASLSAAHFSKELETGRRSRSYTEGAAVSANLSVLRKIGVDRNNIRRKFKPAHLAFGLQGAALFGLKCCGNCSNYIG